MHFGISILALFLLRGYMAADIGILAYARKVLVPARMMHSVLINKVVSCMYANIAEVC